MTDDVPLQFLLLVSGLIVLIYQAFQGDAQLLNPRQRALELYNNFSTLPVLNFEQWCGKPDLLRSEYVESLLETEDSVLTDAMVVDSMAIYNRWLQYGGYRCDPSQYACYPRSPDPDNQKWECVCPGEKDFGNQKVITESTSCKFQSGGTFSLSNYFDEGTPLTNPCADTNFIKPTEYPKSYRTETICGIYKEEALKNPPAGQDMFTIETGLHFNKIACPDDKIHCLMKEFGAECTVENVKKLGEWIQDKKKKYGEDFVRDRRSQWPPCTCSSNAPKDFPNEDPNQIIMDELLESIPKGAFGRSCDRSLLNGLEKCIHSNWYLVQVPQREAYKVLIDQLNAASLSPPLKSRGILRAGSSILAQCEQKFGLECDDVKRICLCKHTPYLPGFRPPVPQNINSEGYCQLDSGSDCLYSEPEFGCPDGEKCLLVDLNATCSKENYEIANNKVTGQWVDDKTEPYLRRCHCTSNPVGPDLVPVFTDPSKNIKANGSLTSGWAIKYIILILIIHLGPCYLYPSKNPQK